MTLAAFTGTYGGHDRQDLWMRMYAGHTDNPGDMNAAILTAAAFTLYDAQRGKQRKI